MTDSKLWQENQIEKDKQPKPQEVKRDKLILENKPDLVRLFELFIKIDRRVNLTGSYEPQDNGNPNNTN